MTGPICHDHKTKKCWAILSYLVRYFSVWWFFRSSATVIIRRHIFIVYIWKKNRCCVSWWRGGGVGPMMAKINKCWCWFWELFASRGVQKCGKISFISDAKEAKPLWTDDGVVCPSLERGERAAPTFGICKKYDVFRTYWVTLRVEPNTITH